MLPRGRVTGTVLCTEADLAGPEMAPPYLGDDDHRDNQKGRSNKNDHGDDREDGDDD